MKKPYTSRLNTQNESEKPSANIQHLRSVSAIWFIPFVALFIGVWMVYYHWSSQGPLISISFKSAEGMSAGKTKIKARNVEIGKVKSITLNHDMYGALDGITVTARMTKTAEPFLVKDSQFWVVSPKVSLSGVSGLDTLVSGVYIEMSPGSSDQEEIKFTALNAPPVTPKGTPGIHLTLFSHQQFSYGKGDPIIYKGLTVGQIEDTYFNFEKRTVYYNAFVKAPYHKLITSNTRFWDATGLRVHFNANGLTVQTGNLETLITNGVTFDVPKGMPKGEVIEKRTDFDIYPDYKSASDQRYKHALNYVILVSDTVRGLSAGAPVEYRGVVVGHVVSINNVKEKSSPILRDSIKIPVLIALHPGRVGLPDNKNSIQYMQKQSKMWIQGGLKAILKTGSLITGQIFIDLQHYPKLPIKQLSLFSGYKVIPTLPDKLSQFIDKAVQFSTLLNNLPLDEITKSSNALLKDMSSTAKEFQGTHLLIEKLNKLPYNTLANNTNALLIEFNKTMKTFKKTSSELETLLAQSNKDDILEQFNETLISIDTMGKDLSTLGNDFSTGSRNYEQIYKFLTSLNSVLYELNPLLNQLKNRPNGLIFNSGSNQQIEPTKYLGNEN